MSSHFEYMMYLYFFKLPSKSLTHCHPVSTPCLAKARDLGRERMESFGGRLDGSEKIV
jgi:hypothetical protein